MQFIEKAALYDPDNPDHCFVIDNGQEPGQIEVGRQDDGKVYVVVNDQHTFGADDDGQAIDLAFAILLAAGATQEDVAHLVARLPHDD